MKVLIIRFSSLGDIVISSSLTQAIHDKYKENVYIVYLTKKKFIDVAKKLPFVDEILTIDDSFFSLVKIIKVINSYSFDLIFDIHNNLRSNFLKIFIKSKVITYNKQRFERMKLVKTRNRNIFIKPTRNAYSSLVTDENYNPKLEKIFLNQKYDFEEEPYVVFVTDASKYTKEWPYFNDLIQLFFKKFSDYKIILLGNRKEEYDFDSKKVYDLRNKTNINELFYIISKAKLAVTNDSGPMHIADAYDIPLIAIFGGTVPELGFAPSNKENNKILENNEIKCRPCSLHGLKYCPLKHFSCMKSINAEIVLNEIEKLLCKKIKYSRKGL